MSLLSRLFQEGDGRELNLDGRSFCDLISVLSYINHRELDELAG